MNEARQLLDRAFNALKNRDYVTEYEEKLEKEISYYLLSTPEPTQDEKPVAYWDTQNGTLIPAVPLSSERTCFKVPLVPLYLHPAPRPEFVRLSDDEISELWSKAEDAHVFARDIEILSREKNNE